MLQSSSYVNKTRRIVLPWPFPVPRCFVPHAKFFSATKMRPFCGCTSQRRLPKTFSWPRASPIRTAGEASHQRTGEKWWKHHDEPLELGVSELIFLGKSTDKNYGFRIFCRSFYPNSYVYPLMGFSAPQQRFSHMGQWEFRIYGGKSGCRVKKKTVLGQVRLVVPDAKGKVWVCLRTCQLVPRNPMVGYHFPNKHGNLMGILWYPHFRTQINV